jgi:hypothetical protein
MADPLPTTGFWLATLLLYGCGRLGYGAPQADGAALEDGSDAEAPGPDGTSLLPDDGSDKEGIDAAPPCTATTGLDYCAALPALSAVPVIDGQLDCGLELRPLPVTAATWDGALADFPPDHEAHFAVAWRADGLYFFVDVRDPSRLPAASGHYAWCGDGVELYVDDDGVYAAPPRYDNPGTRQLILVAPADDVTPSRTARIFWNGEGNVPWTSTDFIAVPTPEGYAVEAFVRAEDLGLAQWSLAEGGRVGMDLGWNVSHPEPTGAPCVHGGATGNRLGQLFLRVAGQGASPDDYPYLNVAAFCAPELAP